MIKNLDIRTIERMKARLNRLYGPNEVEHCVERMVATIGRYGVGLEGFYEKPLWDETTALLITYGDMVQLEGERPLSVLKRFSDHYLKGAIDTIHILPFYPYSSDDGFSVKDYRVVDPDLGDWRDIQEIGGSFKLMFDLVLNHVSAKSRWFADYVSGVAPYCNYFINADPDTDLSAVTRPRNLPLLTRVNTRLGERYLWTTFSADQVDLDFSNPDVLFEFFDILLFYIANGCRLVRLDAIAYLWKKVGTNCIHLKQTHEVVKLLRELLDMVDPGVVLLTETNVPHEENISYFGDGNEAHMVYQFSLPPLLLHGLMTGNSTYLTQWASSLGKLPPKCTYLNFTASHDGIGVRPLYGMIPEKELQFVVERVVQQGGQVSYKSNSDGSESPYELNITYFDALADNPESVTELHLNRFICSQTVAMELCGVPALYFHSLTATRNNYEGVERTGRARTINRKKWAEDELNNLLSDARTHTARVMTEIVRRLKLRAKHRVFHPNAKQHILDFGPQLFVVVREWENDNVICLNNFTDQTIEFHSDERVPQLYNTTSCCDLLSGRRYMGSEKVILLEPYQTIWLELI